LENYLTEHTDEKLDLKMTKVIYKNESLNKRGISLYDYHKI